jgi:sugar phosphate isomerase/epimerase
VLENDIDRLPDLMVQLVNEVDNPFLGLCMDIGHQHVFSELDALEWVRRMSNRLLHVHLHDNDRTGDQHWSLGRGTIDFEPFYAALLESAPQATISLEVEDSMEVKMGDLRKLAAYFTSKHHSTEVSS